jgi:hypothetical protein
MSWLLQRRPIVDRAALMAIVVALMVVLLGLLVVGWRARARRQQGVPAPAAPPEPLDSVLGEFTGQYVATTMANDPLDRIVVHGLGFRGRVTVTAAGSGIRLRIAGARDVWIACDSLRGIRAATWTIDRAVETDGLDVIQWGLGDRLVDSYFRLDDQTAFRAVVAGLIERQAA